MDTNFKENLRKCIEKRLSNNQTKLNLCLNYGKKHLIEDFDTYCLKSANYQVS
jgi:hypothetical protein